MRRFIKVKWSRWRLSAPAPGPSKGLWL